MKQQPTRKQQWVLYALWAWYQLDPFWNTEPFPERTPQANANRRAMWQLYRKGYIEELPDHRWRLKNQP